MNRQQRRMLARQKEVEQKYLNEIYDRQNRVDDTHIKIDLVCIGLALNKLYGWKGNGINNVIQEYIAQVTRLLGDETLEDLAAELNRKADVRIQIVSEKGV